MAKIRVLLIESDAAFVQLVQAALTSSQIGFDVHSVDRLSSAIAALHDGKFNVILLALNLPDTSGVATVEAIHAANKAIPIVALAEDDDAHMEEVLVRGAQQVLRKSDLNTSTLGQAMYQSVRLHRRIQAPPFDPRLERVFGELGQNITAVNNAMAILESKRLDPEASDAVQSARLHLGKMQTSISSYHCPASGRLTRHDDSEMEKHFETGDRVETRNGEIGTVIDASSDLVKVTLDSSLRKSIASVLLTKIDDDKTGKPEAIQID